VWQPAAFTVPDVCERFFVGRERDLLAWYFSRGADNPTPVSMEDFEVYVRALQVPNSVRAGMECFASGMTRRTTRQPRKPSLRCRYLPLVAKLQLQGVWRLGATQVA